LQWSLLVLGGGRVVMTVVQVVVVEETPTVPQIQKTNTI
jgi:hypothetical protein